MIEHSFNLYINDDSKILILGSFPSVKSREKNFYYMHPSNRFYKILNKLFNEQDFLNVDIEVKKNALKRHKIALYDVVEKCDISNSDDNTIKNVIPINLENILKRYKNIKAIYLNGNKAYELFIKYFNNIDISYFKLPSSSPRNATYSLEKLINIWSIIKNY